MNADRGIVRTSVLTLLSLSAACTSDTATDSAPLIGAWRSRIEVQSGAFAEITDLQFMYVFNAGGTLTESSNYDGAPPVPPAYGVWRMIGPNEFEARYEFFSTAPSAVDAFIKGAGWPPSGRGVFTERIEVSGDTRTFTSTIQYEIYGLHDEPLEGGVRAAERACALEFESRCEAQHEKRYLVLSVREGRGALLRPTTNVRFCRPRHCGLGNLGTPIQVQRHVAVGHQHRNHDRDVPDGLPDSKHTEPRHRGHSDQAR